MDVVEVASANGPYPQGTQFARKQLGPNWAADPGARDRFEQEIKLLSTLNHPSIVKVMGVSLPGYPRFYLMPLYPDSLRSVLLRTGRPLALSWAVDFGLAVCRTLSYAHSMGFIHRDLKPENILLTNQLSPVVADWGLGQFIHQHSKVLDLSAQGDESAYYCPLEQWSTGHSTSSGDVYSLGLILAEIVSGFRLPIRPPFSGIHQDVLTPLTIQSSYFNQVIRKMTSLIATQRHQSMQQVEADLDACK